MGEGVWRALKGQNVSESERDLEEDIEKKGVLGLR